MQQVHDLLECSRSDRGRYDSVQRSKKGNLVDTTVFQILAGTVLALAFYILRDMQARVVRLEQMFMVLVTRNGDKELLGLFRKVND